MTTEQTVNSGSHGVKWGLMIGAVYAVFVVLRHRVGANNPMLYSAFMFLGYAVVLALLFISGTRLRRDNGGFIEMKDLFKSLFIAVLVLEFIFALTYFIYLKFVQPGFFEAFRTSTENLMITAKRPQKEIDTLLDTMDQSRDQIVHATVFDFLKSYLYYVGVTGLFALLFSFIIKRTPPVYQS